MIEYEGKKLSIEEVATFPKRTIVNGKVSEAHYFIRKKTHTMVNSIRFKKSELMMEIIQRLKGGWEKDEIIIESANIPFLSIYERWFEN